MPEHVALMEIELGRCLLPDEQIHHKDGNRSNNDLSNLAVLTISEHMRLHRLADISTRPRNAAGNFVAVRFEASAPRRRPRAERAAA